MMVFLFSVLFLTVAGQVPGGYYSSAEGKTGTALQAALHNIIKDHTVKSYDFLWTAFKTTDDKPNGKVWDMYSDIPDGTPNGNPPYSYTFVSDQCGSYGSEGDCYNREHSWPKSWFNDAAPMNSDLFHLYPTDGYVNGRRGNDPFGTVSSPAWTSENGSKSGPCSWPGYTGTVFEPRDEYKGDFARTYFYMSTRYYTEDASWSSTGMTNKSQLKPWAMQMMLHWHSTDPVSQKETDRNNTVYGFQNNRNPFIDHPEYANLIWGTPVDVAALENDITVVEPFPNPAGNECRITLPESADLSAMTVRLITLTGRTYDPEFVVDRQMIRINLQGYPEGFYLLRIDTGKASFHARIVKVQ